MALDPELQRHRDWIGPLQPVGLVVSPPALLAAQAFLNRDILKEQQALLALITPTSREGEDTRVRERPLLPLSFWDLATQVLGWKASKLVGSPGGPTLPESLAVVLVEFGETLRPTYAVTALDEEEADWLMLVQELPDGTPLDESLVAEPRKWQASPQIRFERLLRETGVPIGILANGRFVRLVYAPRGESSGHVTWPVHLLGTPRDRDLLSALYMLLGAARLFALPREQRLPHILKESRKYQNVVSTKLAQQVLEALNELLRGFQSANEKVQGRLLDAAVREDPDHVYGGLLAVLLRLVFILYAEERGLLSSAATYVRNYSLAGLFEQLRIDAGRHPDSMDLRYGAWSRLLVLFRMIHDGANRGDFRLPRRYGHLFDPDGWAFLEGRPYRMRRTKGEPVAVPRVSDGVIRRVLEKLLLLDADRLSYRALDVEQIGSVYENMMGFRLERAFETSIGVGKDHVVVGLETLLRKRGAEREKVLKEAAGVEVTGKAAEALKAAASIADLVAALSRRISPLTPRTVPAGGLYLQPTDERRRSGSHYTPRELTEPIVRTTLRPILEDLGTNPTPEQILALKVCDPAMGSGAFLVETCRQLGEQLEKAYNVHGRPTDVPPDEDLRLYAQRQVAQHCLYGVDKNPFAVDLGKLSLWLATLARDHPFTFLDHSIRHGDSLVGLTREQIASFNWNVEGGLTQQIPLIRGLVDDAIAEAMVLRERIQSLANSDDVQEKLRLLRDADDALAKVRIVGDCVVACFFSEQKVNARKSARRDWEAKVQAWLSGSGSVDEITGFVEELRLGERAVPCFHWEVEFPEVFEPGKGGFHCIVGNPPFLGGTRISTELGMRFFAWLTVNYPPAGHLCDLVAYFFRRSFDLGCPGASLGLLATKTIGQGDTREGGLATILRNGGNILAARRRLAWPGRAAVIVSAVHVRKGPILNPLLDGQPVGRISAFLLKGTQDATPAAMAGTPHWSLGVKIYGQGFLFDDNEPKASTTSEMRSILENSPSLASRVRPYIGGEELNTSSTLTAERWTIYLSDIENEAGLATAGPLAGIVRAKVKPERERLGGNPNNLPLRRRWWAYQAHRPDFFRTVATQERYLAVARISSSFGFCFVDSAVMISEKVVGFILDSFSGFAVMQSRVHEGWARTFSSTLKNDLQYTPSDCFATFPFPSRWLSEPSLEEVGNTYYDFRAAVMVKNDEGLTKTYNRFHDPDETEPDILKLRELHAAMDRSVLDAYGWTDIQPTCEFLLDYEEEGDEEEASGRRRRRKPWRYRWPDEVRDEVLARLLELNARRAEEEASKSLLVVPESKSAAYGKPRRRAKITKKAAPSDQPGLFGEESE